MAAALPPWPHAAAVTKTRVSTCGKDSMVVHHKGHGDPCYVRLHGDLIMSHGSRRAVRERELDHRVKVDRVADFTDIEVCSKLIHRLLAEAPATSEYDLGAENWADPICTPRSIATAIARYVRSEFDDEVLPAPGLEFHIQLPEIQVTLAYSVPKALLLACKEADAARGRKRRRELGGELCPICLLDAETGETVSRLPCSHPFHDGCILAWFRRALTCPTCRRDIKECFPSVGSAASPEDFIHDERNPRRPLSLFDDESEDEPGVAVEAEHRVDWPFMRDSFGEESEDVAEGEQFIVPEWQIFGDEALIDDVAEGERSMASELQLLGDESGDVLFVDDVAEGEASELQLFGDEALLDDVAQGERSMASELQFLGDESEDVLLVDDVAEGEASELQLFGDEALLDDVAEGERAMASELQFLGDEYEDVLFVDDVAEGEAYELQLFGDEALLGSVAEGERSMASELQFLGDETEDELFLYDEAEGEQSLASELQLFGEESEDELFGDDVAEGEQFIASELQSEDEVFGKLEVVVSWK